MLKKSLKNMDSWQRENTRHPMAWNKKICLVMSCEGMVAI
jgi:hypothetical protein